MNRKLIRPDLSDIKEQLPSKAYRARKPVPPEQTSAEAFYYKKQMDNRTKMVIVLKDGEQVRGVIEWYDRDCIKVHRAKDPNLLIMKSVIRYMYKDSETRGDGNGNGLPAIE